MIDRKRTGVESKLRKEQAGFRPGRRTTEQIFILRNIIEQSIEWQSSLYYVPHSTKKTGKLSLDDANFGQK